MKHDEFTGIRRRLAIGFVLVNTVLFAGAGGYYLLGRGGWSFTECLYMTAITISTVGFSEILDVADVPGARLYTAALILSGMGVIVYFGSTLVALIVEGEIKRYFWRKMMSKNIAGLSEHTIICGAGSTGIFIIQEFISTRKPFVVVDESEERIRHIMEEHTGEFAYLAGDASEDHVLLEAGIKKAQGLIAALPEDKDNLMVVISSRQLNPSLRIVSRGIEPTIAAKLRRAGADAIVSPNAIGGMRMASEMIRPQVVQFLDQMLRDREKNLRVEEISVPVDSAYAGKTIAQAGISQLADVLLVAVKQQDASYSYNPAPEDLLHGGSVLIVIGDVDEVSRLKNAFTG